MTTLLLNISYPAQIGTGTPARVNGDRFDLSNLWVAGPECLGLLGVDASRTLFADRRSPINCLELRAGQMSRGKALTDLTDPTRQEGRCISYDLHQASPDADSWFVSENGRSSADHRTPALMMTSPCSASFSCRGHGAKTTLTWRTAAMIA